MPDSCTAEDPGADGATLAIALNGAGVVLGLATLAIGRVRSLLSPSPAKGWVASIPSWTRTAALASVLLGATAVALFYCTGGAAATELGCCVALSNTVGPVPAAFLAAVAAAALLAVDLSGVFCGGGGGGCGGGGNAPPPIRRALFPPGPAWRARDAAVSATAVITAVFSGCVLGLYDPYLRTPEDASWDVTLGAFLVASVLCGPLLVFLSAEELSAFVANGGREGAGEEEKRRGQLPSIGQADEDADADASRLLLLPGEEPGLLAATPSALAVLYHWLVRGLPSLLGNLIVFQIFLWLPVYGAEVASEHLGLGYTDASAAAWASVGLIAAVGVCGHRVWDRWRRRRREGASPLPDSVQ
jgi:hypothetical protein